eukprot:CCRYP_015936-RF/>CCRYP_015936-RF protein AED:0.42 eAED:0.44 QI:0/0/0.5/1/0/0/2/275/118
MNSSIIKRGSHTRKPDRRLKLSKENADSIPEEIFQEPREGMKAAEEKTSRQNTNTCAFTRLQKCCPICINEFSSGDVLKILPRCQHAFHSKCIIQWLTECKDCCPICMTQVVVSNTQA